jgi:integrase
MTGHVRARSLGSFEIRYSLGVDPATGRRKTATATVKGSRKDAERELRRLLRQVDLGEHAKAGPMTTGAWLTQWLGLVEETLAPQSYLRYSSVIRCRLAPTIGDVLLAKLTPAHIAEAYAGMTMLAPRTRHLIHRVLVAALGRAVELQLLARNPAGAFRHRLPRIEATEMAVLTAEQIQLVLEAAVDTGLHTPILLALATGARRGECLALRWRNVNLDAGTVLISESMEQRGGQAKAPKNNRSRTVTLPAFAVTALRARKVVQAEELLRLGVRQNGDTMVCARADGTAPSPDVTTEGFHRLAAKLGLPVHFHSLRHSHATLLLAAGVHPKVAQERLGHSTVALTIDLYSHVSEGMQRDAADKLDKLLG